MLDSNTTGRINYYSSFAAGRLRVEFWSRENGFKKTNFLLQIISNLHKFEDIFWSLFLVVLHCKIIKVRFRASLFKVTEKYARDKNNISQLFYTLTAPQRESGKKCIFWLTSGTYSHEYFRWTRKIIVRIQNLSAADTTRVPLIRRNIMLNIIFVILDVLYSINTSAKRNETIIKFCFRIFM